MLDGGGEEVNRILRPREWLEGVSLSDQQLSGKLDPYRCGKMNGLCDVLAKSVVTRAQLPSSSERSIELDKALVFLAQKLEDEEDDTIARLLAPADPGLAKTQTKFVVFDDVSHESVSQQQEEQGGQEELLHQQEPPSSSFGMGTDAVLHGVGTAGASVPGDHQFPQEHVDHPPISHEDGEQTTRRRDRLKTITLESDGSPVIPLFRRASISLWFELGPSRTSRGLLKQAATTLDSLDVLLVRHMWQEVDSRCGGDHFLDHDGLRLPSGIPIPGSALAGVFSGVVGGGAAAGGGLLPRGPLSSYGRPAEVWRSFFASHSADGASSTSVPDHAPGWRTASLLSSDSSVGDVGGGGPRGPPPAPQDGAAAPALILPGVQSVHTRYGIGTAAGAPLDEGMGTAPGELGEQQGEDGGVDDWSFHVWLKWALMTIDDDGQSGPRRSVVGAHDRRGAAPIGSPSKEASTVQLQESESRKIPPRAGKRKNVLDDVRNFRVFGVGALPAGFSRVGTVYRERLSTRHLLAHPLADVESDEDIFPSSGGAVEKKSVSPIPPIPPQWSIPSPARKPRTDTTLTTQNRAEDRSSRENSSTLGGRRAGPPALRSSPAQDYHNQFSQPSPSLSPFKSALKKRAKSVPEAGEAAAPAEAEREDVEDLLRQDSWDAVASDPGSASPTRGRISSFEDDFSDSAEEDSPRPPRGSSSPRHQWRTEVLSPRGETIPPGIVARPPPASFHDGVFPASLSPTSQHDPAVSGLTRRGPRTRMSASNPELYRLGVEATTTPPHPDTVLYPDESSATRRVLPAEIMSSDEEEGPSAESPLALPLTRQRSVSFHAVPTFHIHDVEPVEGEDREDQPDLFFEGAEDQPLFEGAAEDFRGTRSSPFIEYRRPSLVGGKSLPPHRLHVDALDSSNDSLLLDGKRPGDRPNIIRRQHTAPLERGGKGIVSAPVGSLGTGAQTTITGGASRSKAPGGGGAPAPLSSLEKNSGMSKGRFIGSAPPGSKRSAGSLGVSAARAKQTRVASLAAGGRQARYWLDDNVDRHFRSKTENRMWCRSFLRYMKAHQKVWGYVHLLWSEGGARGGENVIPSGRDIMIIAAHDPVPEEDDENHQT